MKSLGRPAAASLFVLACLISRIALQAAEPEPDMTKWGPKLSDEESARIGALSLPELVEMLKTGDALHKYYALACLKADGGDKKNFDLLLNLARTGPGDIIVEGLVAPVKPSAPRQDRLRVDKFLDFLEAQLKDPSPSVSRPQALRPW